MDHMPIYLLYKNAQLTSQLPGNKQGLHRFRNKDVNLCAFRQTRSAPGRLEGVVSFAAGKMPADTLQRLSTENASVPANIASTTDAPRSSVPVWLASDRRAVRTPPTTSHIEPIVTASAVKTAIEQR